VGIAAYVPICIRLKANTDKPVWIKANAGLPEIVDGRTVWKTTPEEFASFAPALVAAGANFLGGCCGTRPEFIAATLKALGR
jgi:5-methyltetrahydrofolate--homocysteine methyltransferase